MNIWTSENIMKYWDGTSSTAKGEWTVRNGEPAISIQPNNFHQNSAYIQIFKDEFLPNTQYAISLWMDVDDVIYNGNNVPGGMNIYYTDGTSATLIFTGNKTNPKGWQNILFFTDASKSVAYMASHYYTSIPVYYRWDSYITPMQTPSIEQNGVIHGENFINDNAASIFTSGLVYGNSFYEF